MIHVLQPTHGLQYFKYLYEVPDPYSVQDALSFSNSAHNDFESLSALDLAIEYKGMSELRDKYPYMFVGSIGLKNIDLINKKADLGYWIREEYWGRGVATECVRLIINYAFSSSGLEKRGDSLCLSRK